MEDTETKTLKGKEKVKIFDVLTNPAIILIFLAAILLIISMPNFMNTDEGIWSYIGRIWVGNALPPYVGAVENKTPGIFILNAISCFLFGVNTAFIRILGIISLLLSSFFVFLIAKKLHSRHAGIFAMYIFGLTCAWNLLDGSLVSQTEVFMVLFSTLAFLFLIRAKESRKHQTALLFAGLAMGISIAFKQIAVTTSCALVAFYLLYTAQNFSINQKWKGLLFMFFGICISSTLSLLPLFLSGVHFVDYLDGAWFMLLKPVSGGTSQQHLEGFFRVWQDSRIVIFYPCLFLIFMQRELVRNKYFIGLLAWFIFDFIGVNASGNYYGHQIKQIVPSLSVITGIAVSNLFIVLRGPVIVAERRLTMCILTLLFILFPYKPVFSGTYKILTGYPDDPGKEIGTWVRNHTLKEEFIYVIGYTGSPILSYSERVSSSKYFNSFFLAGNAEREELLSDLIERPPAYILQPSPKPGIDTQLGVRVEDYILSNYVFVLELHDWKILKRK